jgi:large subunit ribosomal protein L21
MEHEARMEHEGSRLFAVIKTGGKQYSVAAGDTITVMTLAGNPGDSVTFDRVLMLSQDGEPALGTPFLDGASVGGEIVEHKRGPKAIAFKKRRRKNSKCKHGHRQDLTLVRITGFLTGGADPFIETAASE